MSYGAKGKKLQWPSNSAHYKPPHQEMQMYKQPMNNSQAIGNPYPQVRRPNAKGIDAVGPTAGVAHVCETGIFSLTSTPFITPVNIISAGSSSFQRVGRRCNMKSIYIKGRLVYNGVSTVAGALLEPQFFRIAVVYDKQTNGTAATFSEMFQDQLSGSADLPSAQAISNRGVNLNSKERFEVIADVRGCAPNANVAAGVATAVNPALTSSSPLEISIYRKLKGREIQFREDSTPVPVIGDISTGALYLVTWGSNASAASFWALEANVRVRYTDQ